MLNTGKVAAKMNDNNRNYVAPHRAFTEAIKVCFTKYATFKGRASRSEYWWFFLFVWLVPFIVVVPYNYLLDNHYLSDNFFSLLWSLATLLPSFAVGTRRLHDIGRSGWWMLLVVPQNLSMSLPESYELDVYDLVFTLSLIIWLPLLVMLCFRSKTDPTT